MSSALKARITDDMKVAMRAKETERLGVIRLVLAACKQKEVDERVELDDTAVLAILDKMIKQRRDSVKQYQDAGRQELADQEIYEIDVISAYLPTPLTESELKTLITNAMSQTGASSIKDMGKVMAAIKADVQGRADMGAVSNQIKALLS